jgi:mannose-6-phosphate isomerase-like protein (cupin superfamily)
MDFDDRYTLPEYCLSRVLFYPDRVCHAVEVAASRRSARYRYNVQRVRNKASIRVVLGEVYLDANLLGAFLRVDYQAARLAEASREQHRMLGDRIRAWIRLHAARREQEVQGVQRALAAEGHLTLHYDPACHSYFVELWETLEAPATSTHDFAVLDLMGRDRPITRVRELAPVISSNVDIRRIEVAFAELDRMPSSGAPISRVAWDNNLQASHEEPRMPDASSPQNTVSDLNYLLDFQRGWFLHADDIPAVRYRNPLMDADHPDRSDTNIVAMRWILQRALGGSVVFFHEVTLPPGATEGTHQHVGSEEVYYIVQGTGTAYMGAGDDPATDSHPTVTLPVYDVGKRSCTELAVRPGHVIFTKSEGIHGIRNDGTVPLKFVAFLYHAE